VIVLATTHAVHAFYTWGGAVEFLVSRYLSDYTSPVYPLEGVEDYAALVNDAREEILRQRALAGE
jgi:hypothetical protein